MSKGISDGRVHQAPERQSRRPAFLGSDGGVLIRDRLADCVVESLQPPGLTSLGCVIQQYLRAANERATTPVQHPAPVGLEPPLKLALPDAELTASGHYLTSSMS